MPIAITQPHGQVMVVFAYFPSAHFCHKVSINEWCCQRFTAARWCCHPCLWVRLLTDRNRNRHCHSGSGLVIVPPFCSSLPFTSMNFGVKIDMTWAGVTQRKSACFPSKLPALKARWFGIRYGITLTKQALLYLGLTRLEFADCDHFWTSLPCFCSFPIFSIIASSSHRPKVFFCITAATRAWWRISRFTLILVVGFRLLCFTEE